MSSNKKSNAGLVRKFARFYKPHAHIFALDLVSALLICVIDLAFPLVSRMVMQNLLPEKLYTTFFIVMGALALAYVLRTFFAYIVTYIGHHLGVLMEADMRSALFSHMQKLSFSFYDNNRTGYLMSRVTTDLFDITELAHHGPEDIFTSTVTMAGAIVIMFSVNWKLALMLAVLVPVGVTFTILNRKRMMSTSKRVKERQAGINAGIESSISGARVAKAFVNEDYEIEKFESSNEYFKSSKREFYAAMAIFLSGMEFFTNIFHVAVIAFGGYLIMRGELDYIGLITFTLYVSAFLTPVRKFSQFMELYSSGMAGFERFDEIMSIAPEIVDVADAKPLKNVAGEIVFNNVGFSYNNHKSVLKDINLNIKPGQTIALVGPSGGGKTTLSHLIPRFYEIDSGSITIDENDIRDVTLESLRENIGIVSQDVFLFAATVKENIRYGKINATDEEIIEAAKRAEIHDMIIEMEHGYDTNVGDRGVLLSGGQKQRISIARIFLKNPPILILDEATSALDTITEAKIQAAFTELSKGRTTLVIAHRLSTVHNADEIIVISDKGIEERGTHDELIAQRGAYASLYESQLK